MQTFTPYYNTFVSPNTNQYVYLYPSYFMPDLTSFTTYSTLQNQIQTPEQISSTLGLTFQSNLSQNDTNSPKESQKKEKNESKSKQKVKAPIQKEEEQFSIKLNKKESFITYKKKNTQSNIVNQIFSFLNSDRSKDLVFSFFKSHQKVEQFYRLMLKIKQANKKYINRYYLQRLLAFQTNSQFQRAFVKSKLVLTSREEIKEIFRVLIFSFLRGRINMTLITSCKIYKETLPEHFWRKREIMNFLFNNQEQ